MVGVSPQPRGRGDIKCNSPIDDLESFIEPLKPFLSIELFQYLHKLLCINNNNSTISVLKFKFIII